MDARLHHGSPIQTDRGTCTVGFEVHCAHAARQAPLPPISVDCHRLHPAIIAALWGAVCFRSSSERAVTDVRDGPPGWTFETNGTDSSRRLFQKSVRVGRGRLAVTGRWDGLLKQTARIPHADCFRSPSERAVDGWP